MLSAGIIGWGKCLPPAILSNADIATFLDTSDEWITSRTGISTRRIAHCSLADMAYVASAQALACAGLAGKDIDLIIFGTTTHDDQCPNMASGLQQRLGANGCAAMDINTACTSFLYGLSTATAMIRSGVVRTALVVGGELISPYMDWSDRNVAILFGDGAAAVVLQASNREEGVLLEKLGCYGDSREILRIHGMGGNYLHQGRLLGDTSWQFEGQDIFKKAVMGMGSACEDVLRRATLKPEEIDLVIPHQANLRIIEYVAKRAQIPMERVFVNVQRYGNMSAATVPVALCEALEAQRIQAGSLLLMPAFGAGLTFCAHLLRWGERITPMGQSNATLPPLTLSALELVVRYKSAKGSTLQ
ncbi:MAG: ketoacyl-ACP synthase III [Gammaproteobacteria bacterium]|nr:ketoacyl-ACP synthase III [Gammaproteobacteria bacterium]